MAAAFRTATTSLKNNGKLMRLLAEAPYIPLRLLHGIPVPTRVTGGDHEVIKSEHALLIAQNIPNAYWWMLPNSGRSTPLVYKNEFNKKVDDFFANPTGSWKNKHDFFRIGLSE